MLLNEGWDVSCALARVRGTWGDAAFTVGAYSVNVPDNNQANASITLTDEDDVGEARVDFSPGSDDMDGSPVEIGDDNVGRVLMTSDSLEPLVDLLKNENPVYVSFSTDTNLFIVATGTNP